MLALGLRVSSDVTGKTRDNRPPVGLLTNNDRKRISSQKRQHTEGKFCRMQSLFSVRRLLFVCICKIEM